MNIKAFVIIVLSLIFFALNIYLVLNSQSVYGSFLLSVYTVLLIFGLYVKAKGAVLIHSIVFLATPIIKPEIFIDSVWIYLGCVFLSFIFSCSMIFAMRLIKNSLVTK